jgi:hydrogenase maturation protein HypF
MLNRVVLSGGVFQNSLLLERTCQQLKSRGFDVFTHSRVPPNDGGIALGQAAVASALLTSGKI